MKRGASPQPVSAHGQFEGRLWGLSMSDGRGSAAIDGLGAWRVPSRHDGAVRCCSAPLADDRKSAGCSGHSSFVVVVKTPDFGHLDDFSGFDALDSTRLWAVQVQGEVGVPVVVVTEVAA